MQVCPQHRALHRSSAAKTAAQDDRGRRERLLDLDHIARSVCLDLTDTVDHFAGEFVH